MNVRNSSLENPGCVINHYYTKIVDNAIIFAINKSKILYFERNEGCIDFIMIATYPFFKYFFVDINCF